MIHGDSFFKGRYAIALTEVVSADSVLMRTPMGAILPVSQRPAVSIEEVQDEELPVVDVETLQKIQTREVRAQARAQTHNTHHFFQPAIPVDDRIIPEVAPVRKVDPPSA